LLDMALSDLILMMEGVENLCVRENRDYKTQ